jgi:hypothetical protein
MAVTWTISTLERNSSDDGVIVAHWRASDSEVVGTGDDAVTHSGSSYGTCGFTPDSSADGYTAYADITETQAIGWVKDSMGEEAVTGVEDSIAAQIADSKAPAVATGTPW